MKPADAALEIRALPWRPRYRKPEAGLDVTDIGVPDLDDDFGVGIVVAIALIVLLPVIVVLLAIVLLPVEALLAVIVGALVLVARFTGVIPWTVTYTDAHLDLVSEKHRFLPGAVRRVRELNGDRRVRVRWSWTGPAAATQAPAI
ncbi:hypothetical protein [Cellulomonas edaphi]|uniref:Uncharacterized protein n=1 Tax=Cellulomonas edaphi TaxID=3053468 RepID=A0ABT7S9R4_9CELL|nr:hypothetical protein [Cellulomons edaphi]MDM7832345.1 hypothetical protein [Cellulomons edaphi]